MLAETETSGSMQRDTGDLLDVFLAAHVKCVVMTVSRVVDVPEFLRHNVFVL